MTPAILARRLGLVWLYPAMKADLRVLVTRIPPSIAFDLPL